MGVHASAFAHGLPPPRQSASANKSAGRLVALFLLCRWMRSPAQPATLRAWDAYVPNGSQLQAPRPFRGGRRGTQHRCSGRHHQQLAQAAFSRASRSIRCSIACSIGHATAAGKMSSLARRRPIGRRARVSVRLVRRSIVTVSCGSERDPFRRRTARRHRPQCGNAYPEIGGDDHGFLAAQFMLALRGRTGSHGRVAVAGAQSRRALTARPIASPLVRRVARESMVRTLEALRRQYGTPS
jgi:hypothetical protein